jgi:uncharacterized protein
MRYILLCLFAIFPVVAASPDRAPWDSQGILYLDQSPHARLRTVPVHAVKMGQGFWSARMQTNVEKSIPTMLEELEKHGVVDNFRRLSGRKQAPRHGPLYTDSDIYKWMEAAAFALQSHPDARLRETIDALTSDILAAQEPSGYLNTYWVHEREQGRFQEQTRGHELYCLGHLLQAGIAYYRATGNTKLLEGGRKFADYLVENFGPEKRPALTGHPELEMALVELYRTTGERKYLDFAGYLLSGVERERLKLTDSQVKYMFSGIPFTSRTQFEGHAVRAMYAASGATDYYAETGEAAYWKTLETLWHDLVNGKMYITGGVGSRAEGEAIGEAYELPNAQAYGESCAAIGNMMWNWRMLMVSGEARFTDVIERALYNGINSGMSLSGTLYCYRNPLESAGEKIRNEWYDTTCCPPNLERIFASLPGYLYSTSDRGVYVNLFHTSDLDWHLPGGAGLKISQKTNYPWDGSVDLTVTPASPSEFSVFVRIPSWSRFSRVTVNGKPAGFAAKPGEYFEVRRTWTPGDRVQAVFDVSPRLVQANPLVRENVGRVAVERGPLVYCLEQADQHGVASVLDAALLIGTNAKFNSRFRPDLLGGVVTLEHPGTVSAKPLSSEPLYESVPRRSGSVRGKSAELTLIPYYAWANRGPMAMMVWIPFKTDSSR